MKKTEWTSEGFRGYKNRVTGKLTPINWEWIDHFLKEVKRNTKTTQNDERGRK